MLILNSGICRSPMAEFILKALVRAKGLEDMYYIDAGKRARQVTPEDYDRFDRLIC